MQGQNLRVSFNTVIPCWQIEQKVIRRRPDHENENGSTYTPPLSITGWELRSNHVNFYIAMTELLELACTDGERPLQIESIDLGPLDPNSSIVQLTITGLESLTL